ncbi:hypothetical protein LSH36_310g00055 [Paralvinella palmiformis]|uniref:Mediator of RNA polymerase II transcription subunit 23 n=1 Tax=Paralvinella palmiformis TaxID=53620 RepID=A0AAD9JIG9_9ANNE|nr:hypothetical protein LSH36_310g00055 [Paralvinella palmiformis]
MALLTVEESVKNVVSQLLRAETIEEAFCGFIAQTPESDALRKDSCLDIVKSFWRSLPQESQDAALKQYVSHVYDQPNACRGRLLLDMLEALVDSSSLSARAVCDALLNCDQLTYENSEKWCQTFKLVRRIIGGVDYKVCKNLFAILLV